MQQRLTGTPLDWLQSIPVKAQGEIPVTSIFRHADRSGYVG
jgi:hypothetical protein